MPTAERVDKRCAVCFKQGSKVRVSHVTGLSGITTPLWPEHAGVESRGLVEKQTEPRSRKVSKSRLGCIPTGIAPMGAAFYAELRPRCIVTRTWLSVTGLIRNFAGG